MADEITSHAERIAAARAALASAYAANPEAVQRFEARKARLAAAAKRERERFEYLVLGEKRPLTKRTVSKQRGKKRVVRKPEPITLAPGVDEAADLHERWSHKQGTPETLEHAANTHQGALAQLHRNGGITDDQLAWAAEIAMAAASIQIDVAIDVASLEARVDSSRYFADRAWESVRRVRLHMAYTRWRGQIPLPRQMVLDMIVGDQIGFTVAARRYCVHHRKARRLLIAALDRWPDAQDWARSRVSADDVTAANAA